MDKIPRKLLPEITKTKIVNVIEEMIETTAVSDLTIRDICKKASVSVGTFYLHFSSKEEAVLYIYRLKDTIYDSLCLNSTIPIENIRSILLTCLKMVKLGQLDYHRQVYICRLNNYDEYLFSENRSVFLLLDNQIRQLTDKDSKKITTELLEYCRGKIFNLIISFQTPDLDWYGESLDMAMDYLDFLLKR